MPVFQVSEISIKNPVTSRSRDCSLGKNPTTRVRRLIWLLRVSQAFEVWILAVRCGEVEDGEALGEVDFSPLGELGLSLRIALDEAR